ncbi:hypothetical protein SLE2022_288860 [Rubroshorea leprosula]
MYISRSFSCDFLLGASEAYESCESLDETSKKGLCWFELKRAGLPQWGVGQQQVKFMDHQGQSAAQQASSFIEDEYEKDDKKAVKLEYPSFPETGKRKCVIYNQLSKENAARRGRQSKRHNPMGRWPAERIKVAEDCMLEILKAEGAVFGNPISRPALRQAARKRIGDTGLLDHLLKHIDGKVAPGGIERFRRCYNTTGVMEYWLESADLVNIRREAGASDPNWVPPTWWKPGMGPIQESMGAGEVKVLKEEVAKMKRDMEFLIKQRDQDQSNSIEEIHKKLVKLERQTDHRMMGLSSSLARMQDMYQEMVTWRTGVDRQLIEISNSVSSLQASKQCTTFSPSAPERWEDWLESTNLENFQGDDLAPWLDSTGVVEFGQGNAVQNPCLPPPTWSKPGGSLSQFPISAPEQELINDDVAKMNSDVLELVPVRQEEDQVNVTPDSSVTGNSKLDLDSSVILFQEMVKELTKWKAKTEQQLLEISSAVSAIQASRQ